MELAKRVEGYLHITASSVLQPDELTGSRVKSPGLLEDWWQGYPVWQGQRDAAVPMVIVVTLAAVLGVVGNLIVTVLLCCPSRRPLTTTSFYLLHRAIADTCVQICQPLVVVTLVCGQHPWGCIFNPAMMQLGMLASTVFLSGLALDTYLASIPRLVSPKARWRLLRVVVTTAWLAGLVIFTLTLLGIFRRGDMCLEAPLFLIHSHEALFVCLLLVFLLPLLVLGGSMALLLKGMTAEAIERGGRGTQGTAQESTETSPRKLSMATSPLPRHMRPLAALSLVFLVAHVPYWTLRIHYSRVPELLPFTVHAVVISLVVVGTALDPLLAVWFRVELWQGVVSRLPSHPAPAVSLHQKTGKSENKE